MRARHSLLSVALLAAWGCGHEISPRPTSAEIRIEAAVATPVALTEKTEAKSAPAAAGEAEAWGDLIGQFVFDGDPPVPQPVKIAGDIRPQVPLVDETLIVDAKTKGIANIVIYVRTPKIPVHPQYEASAAAELVCDNRDFRFVPRVLPVRLGQTLVFTNGDPVPHNSNFQPLGDEVGNPLIAAGGRSDKYRPQREQTIPQPVGCNIHPWMQGYILPRANPYVAVTGTDGRFRLARLPAGELVFKVWHERCGWLQAEKNWNKGEFKLTIKAESEPTDLGTIRVPKDALKL